MKVYPVIRNRKRIGGFPTLLEARAACYALASALPGDTFSWGTGSAKVVTDPLEKKPPDAR